jgi:hypothetical protein
MENQILMPIAKMGIPIYKSHPLNYSPFSASKCQTLFFFWFFISLSPNS